MAQELKAYNVVATADVNPEVVDSLGCTEWAGYDKDEVDAVLAEKDKKIESLEKELEDIRNTYKKSVEVKVTIWERCKKAEDTLEKTERRLKRALYKACANWAHFVVAFYASFTPDEPWYKMELKCREMAETFKEVK